MRAFAQRENFARSPFCCALIFFITNSFLAMAVNEVKATGTEQLHAAQSVGGAASQPVSAEEKIRELRQRLEYLERRMAPAPEKDGKSLSPDAAAPAAAPATVDEEEQIAQAALERTLIQRSGILLPPWTLEIEPSLTYAHTSSDSITIDGVSVESALVIGEIVSDRIRRNILIPALTLRLGMPGEFQAETKVPYRYEEDRIVRGDSSEETREGNGLGDIEVALSHQLMREKGWIPDLLGSLRWKTDTGHSPFRLQTDELSLGTGYHALQFMLTAVKVREPVAFFGSLLYTKNFPVSKENGRVSPGDIWGINLGLALGLNLDTSINFVWEQRFIDSTEVDGNKVIGTASYPGNLRVGATYTFSPAVSLDVSVIIGLTRDAPDVQAIVAVPIRMPQLFAGSGK